MSIDRRLHVGKLIRWHGEFPRPVHPSLRTAPTTQPQPPATAAKWPPHKVPSIHPSIPRAARPNVRIHASRKPPKKQRRKTLDRPAPRSQQDGRGEREAHHPRLASAPRAARSRSDGPRAPRPAAETRSRTPRNPGAREAGTCSAHEAAVTSPPLTRG
ncbi:hypothetical protein DAI22_07g211700 [Oryza sativa Japonica Group]|nr:hypothetical protein DAI22_07g211700 [Oryza sativa Japonica Group]